jgi:glycosyltransferase involved in cell wall biosynthesis
MPRTWRDLERAYLSTVDEWRGARWAADASHLGRALVERDVHRAVVSSGPPHFIHAAARRIAREMALPFVMDLRDPWSMVQRLPESMASPVTLAVAARGERRAIRDASLIVANTEPVRDMMAHRYPAAAARMIAVPNGYDDESVPACRRSPRFVVAYAGTIYLDRDPRPLFRAAAQVIAAHHLTPAQFGIELMGEVSTFDGVPLRQMASDEGVEAYVRTRKSGPRREALEFLASASMLVLLPQDSDLAIPAKLFEYMLFDASLMVLATPSSATAQLLRGVEADVVAPDDVAGMRRTLEEGISRNARGERSQRLARHPQLSRRARAAELFAAIEAIAGGLPPVEPVGGSPRYDHTSDPDAGSGAGSTASSVCIA